MSPPTLSPARPESLAAAPDGQESGLRNLLARPSVFLLVILAAQMMVVLDTTIVNVALPHIQRGLGFSNGALSWVLNGYLLAFGGLLLLGARAGDLLGRRITFLAGIAIFSASSLLGGLAVAGWMLLAARVVQGIGAALAAPSALSLLTAVFPEGPQRMRAIALYTTVAAAGGAIGLVAGGLLTELVSWRWVMFVNVPIAVAAWLLGRVVIPETDRRQGRFDLAGALTSTIGMTGIVLGLVEAGTTSWTDPLTVASFAVGAVLLGVFLHNEGRAEEPILPLRLLAHPTRSAANVARGLVYAGMYGMFFFLSQFFQDVQHYSPLRAGVAFLPMPATVFVASQLTSRVLVRRIPQRSLMLLGIVSAGLGLLVTTRLSVATSYAEIVVAIVLLGAGAGISFVSLTSASLADVAPADAGAASGLINVSQQVGAALGLAVLVSAFGAVTHHAEIGARVAPSAVQAFDALILHGLHDVFGLGLLFTALALAIVATFVRRQPRSPRPERAEVVEFASDRELLDEWPAEAS
jgi:EmrB/QacA subfamily drug resistance transporter